ncbi:MAG: hypothetical protein ACLQG3_04040 [Terracidiphilus sp.]
MEHLHSPGAASWAMLAGRWFVFWGAGVRLLGAGLRQYFQPKFTAVEIFRMKTEEALPIIREHGIGNFAVGVAGVASLWVPGFIVPVALIAAIFFGVAGVFHVAAKTRSMNENIAMVSDFWVALVLAAYLIHTWA